MDPDPPQITYQAYKSKRHSRTVSNSHMMPNVSPPPVSRPLSAIGSPTHSISTSPALTSFTHQVSSEKEQTVDREPHHGFQSTFLRLDSVPSNWLPASPVINNYGESSEPSSPGDSSGDVTITPSPNSSAVSVPLLSLNGHGESEAGPSSVPSSPKNAVVEFEKQMPATRRSTTFRRIPLRNPSRSPLSPSPLRPTGPHPRVSSVGSAYHVLEHDQPSQTTEKRNPVVSMTSNVSEPFDDKQLPEIPTIPSIDIETEVAQYQQQFKQQVSPNLIMESAPQSTFRIHPPKSLSKAPSPTTASPSPLTSSPVPALVIPPSISAIPRPPAPYRPGFQPKGVYRPRTDEFSAIRREKRDLGRVERTKLNRRLEKLINLHFSSNTDKLSRPSARRVSSIFDLDISDIKNMDPGGLWKGMLQSQGFQGAKAEIRAAEQRITPWLGDATVSKCPLCSASFHPLTNRKHHCRLCGKIICSLPVKQPQRPFVCSLLFVVDPQTRRIEEVDEGVDYGVRKRRTPSVSVQGKGKEKEEAPEDEKFLKGVRICRECRPVLLRQQHDQESRYVPTFARLYETLIVLEKEIEDSLPQFQELLINLGDDVQPTKEASAARKRILQAFAQYDALSKRIRKLPCPEGAGSSQDRIQLAIVTRANLFLQSNMFPLQSLPTSKRAKTSGLVPEDGPAIDPDSVLALTLQPLLEQEVLLESFVEEAKARRKFEDAKTLKANLSEIRIEIDRIVANADSGKQSWS